MDVRFKELFNLLGKQVELYSRILESSEQKKEIIISGNRLQLQEIVKIEEGFVGQMHTLETQHNWVIERLLPRLDKNLKQVQRLDQLYPYMDDEDLKTATDLNQKLRGILNSLKGLNELNKKLLQQSMDYIEFSINVLTSANQTVSGCNPYDGGFKNTNKPVNQSSLFQAKG